MPEDWTTGVDLHLDVASASGRRRAIEEALRQAVRTGRLAPGARLPSSRSLAAELRVARGTVTAAYEQLVAEGYLSSRTGSGTLVAGLPEPTPPSAALAPSAWRPRHDLRPGSPDVMTFPAATWLRATRRAMSRAPATRYGYAEPAGLSELRTALTEYLGRVRGVRTRPEQIVVTSGYVQGLALLTQALAAAGTPRIAMEDPCLDFHRDVVRRNGGQVVALAVDIGGARTDLLDGAGYDDVAATVLTPAHQYPMGATLQPDRRRAALRWARERGALIIEDDYDGEFRYDRQPVGALQGAAPDQVAYLGTAAKTLAPGLRLGWLVLPQRLIAPVVEAKRHLDLHTEVIGQLALAELIDSHTYDRQVRSCRLRYRRRRDLLLGRLSALPLAVEGVAAGLHVTIMLPEHGPNEQEVAVQARARGLAVGALTGHWHEDGPHPQGIVVGYSAPSEGAYRPAVEALARLLEEAIRRQR